MNAPQSHNISIRQPILIGALIIIIVFSIYRLVPLHNQLLTNKDKDHEALYLPSLESVEFVTFGYKNIVADLLWFKTISYFGKHYATDRNYSWLSHMCDLVTTLDKHALASYQFCANMLSWEADTPQLAIDLLSKAIQNNPNSWRMPYLRGFTYLFFLKNKVKLLVSIMHYYSHCITLS